MAVVSRSFDRMSILSSGKIGINTLNPVSSFYMQNTSDAIRIPEFGDEDNDKPTGEDGYIRM